MAEGATEKQRVADDDEPLKISVPLERDLFLRRLLRELTGSLEEVVGLEEASGFISLVDQHIAEWLEPAYREAYRVEVMDAGQVARALVDLKARIQGDFYIEECTPERIVLGNRACPFGEQVLGRTSHCLMTSTVFGTITAENTGYAKVSLEDTIARGSSGCRVVTFLQETPDAGAAPGIEYFSD
ncbi:methanogen output domain 1-containing protein [Thiohalorhabdus sp.]|uniref:methanogen output domain 1-containing protein n=1 Tax=Thiohalorhabdus sp. TaxID=3094134 RepID=UPI002FC37928